MSGQFLAQEIARIKLKMFFGSKQKLSDSAGRILNTTENNVGINYNFHLSSRLRFFVHQLLFI